MTFKIRSYSNWGQEANDSLSEWFWTQIVGKTILVGALISAPMFAVGALSAPQGTDRITHGYETTVDGHEFLWDYAGKAANKGIEIVGPWIDNN